MPVKGKLLFCFLICTKLVFAQQQSSKSGNKSIYFYPQFLLVNQAKAEFFYMDTSDIGFSASFSLFKGTTNKEGQFNSQTLSWEFENNPSRRNDKFSGYGISAGGVYVLSFKQNEKNSTRFSFLTDFYYDILDISINDFDFFPIVIDGTEFVTFDLRNHRGLLKRSGFNSGMMIDFKFRHVMLNMKLNMGYQWVNLSESIRRFRNYDIRNDFSSPGYSGFTTSFVIGVGYSFH